MRDEVARLLSFIMETLDEYVDFWRSTPIASDYSELLSLFESMVEEDKRILLEFFNRLQSQEGDGE